MPWMLPAAMVASSAIGAGASIFGSSKKQKMPSLPPFYHDPLVDQSDSTLVNFGQDVLKGILPASYQDLLQFDSPQFEGMLHNSNRDIQSAGLETAARMGNARSGAAEAGISQAVANNSANLRYSDFLNTIANQKSVLGSGLDALQVGGNMALTNQGQVNSYNLGGYQSMLGITPSMSKLSMEGQGQTGNAIGSALGSVISSLPYLQGAFGPQPQSMTGQLGAFNSNGANSYSSNIDDILGQNSGALTFPAYK